MHVGDMMGTGGHVAHDVSSLSDMSFTTGGFSNRSHFTAVTHSTSESQKVRKDSSASGDMPVSETTSFKWFATRTCFRVCK